MVSSLSFAAGAVIIGTLAVIAVGVVLVVKVALAVFNNCANCFSGFSSSSVTPRRHVAVLQPNHPPYVQRTTSNIDFVRARPDQSRRDAISTRRPEPFHQERRKQELPTTRRR